MRIASFAFAATWRRAWRTAVIVALIGGVLGAVAMAALAGARRTDSAYGRYLQAANASDVMIDIPGALLPVVRQVEALPGKTSTATWLGLNGAPVIRGKVDPAFDTDGLAGSLDGEYFRQDKMTVLAGREPQPNSTNEMAITQPMAQAFGLHPGDHMTWQFYQNILQNGLPTGASVRAQRTTFVVTAIVAVPPALGDQFDDIDTGILPPAATVRYLDGEWSFAWVAMRLRAGDAGVPALQAELKTLAARISAEPDLHHFPVTFAIRRLAVAKHEAQQSIEPQAVALALLGALIAVAMLVLVGQGLAQLLGRSAGDGTVLRALGATRREAAMSLAAPGVVAIAGSTVLAVAGAIALSPLAPVGPVRRYDPQTGAEADWLVLGAGAAAMLLLLGGVLTALAWRAAGQVTEPVAARPLGLMTASRRSGLPVTALTGMRYALERGYGRQRAPVRATLAGSVIAVMALAVSLVFSASLGGLVSHPARYGWNWTTVVQAQGGWSSWPPDAMAAALAHQPGVTGWSELGFSQLAIRHQEVPVLGLLQMRGSVQPPTTSGHRLSAPDQIEFGTVTMRVLGLHLGEKISVGTGRSKRVLTIVGTVTLPSMGTVLTDHVSLGRGAMMTESTMLSVEDLPAYTEHLFSASGGVSNALSNPAFPSAVAIDATSKTAAKLAAQRIFRADPDQQPGGMYTLPPEKAAQVVNFQQIGGLPITIALGVAIAAMLALGLTIVASVRQRRRELALLKSLGMRRGQIRAVVVSQTSTILVVAVLFGIPLGIAAGRWAWTAFASAIGVVPAPVVPATALILGVVALLAAGNALAAWPAAIAAKTPVARLLRSE